MAVFNPTCDAGAQTATLKDLRERILIRLGFAAQLTTPPPGMAAFVDEFLASAQSQLFLRYPQLENERWYTWTTVVDDRFYTLADHDDKATCAKFPDPKKITWVGVEDSNGAWYPLTEGINPLRYTSVDNSGRPDSYEIRQELEVFPAPDSILYKIRIKGFFGLLAFAADADIATIDSELIFLLALANAKAHYSQPDADIYFAQATSHLGQLTAGAHGTARYVPGTVEVPPETKPVLLPLP
jgi:hypothetical protein